jgi:hypothetical protein
MRNNCFGCPTIRRSRLTTPPRDAFAEPVIAREVGHSHSSRRTVQASRAMSVRDSLIYTLRLGNRLS